MGYDKIDPELKIQILIEITVYTIMMVLNLKILPGMMQEAMTTIAIGIVTALGILIGMTGIQEVQTGILIGKYL